MQCRDEKKEKKEEAKKNGKELYILTILFFVSTHGNICLGIWTMGQ